MKTCSHPERSEKLLSQITSMDFINEIIGYSELIYEYIKQIQILGKKSDNKLIYLKTLENLLNDSLERYIIEKIEGAILEILWEMEDELPQQCDRILKEFYESKLIAKKTAILMIITQFYDMLSENTQNYYWEIFNSLVLEGTSVMKRKICQNLHEAKFLSNSDALEMLEQYIKDQNE